MWKILAFVLLLNPFYVKSQSKDEGADSKYFAKGLNLAYEVGLNKPAQILGLGYYYALCTYDEELKFIKDANLSYDFTIQKFGLRYTATLWNTSGHDFSSLWSLSGSLYLKSNSQIVPGAGISFERGFISVGFFYYYNLYHTSEFSRYGIRLVLRPTMFNRILNSD